MGGAWASVWVEFVEAVGGGGHTVIHPVEETGASCCHRAGGRAGGHHRAPVLLPQVEAAAMATVAGVPGGRLGRVTGERG